MVPWELGQRQLPAPPPLCTASQCVSLHCMWPCGGVSVRLQLAWGPGGESQSGGWPCPRKVGVLMPSYPACELQDSYSPKAFVVFFKCIMYMFMYFPTNGIKPPAGMVCTRGALLGTGATRHMGVSLGLRCTRRHCSDQGACWAPKLNPPCSLGLLKSSPEF